MRKARPICFTLFVQPIFADIFLVAARNSKSNANKISTAAITAITSSRVIAKRFTAAKDEVSYLTFHASDLAPAAAGCPSQNWPGQPHARPAPGQTVEKFQPAHFLKIWTAAASAARRRFR